MENTDTEEEDGDHIAAETNDIDLVILNSPSNEVNLKTRDNVLGRKENVGLFVYAPKCCQNAFLSVYGLLFFLSWASTIQVSTGLLWLMNFDN